MAVLVEGVAAARDRVPDR